MPGWGERPRKVTVVVDNPSWILPWAEKLVTELRANGDEAVLARSHAEVGDGVAAFYLGCVHITPPEVLARNAANLVVHASDLPQGRGFSPWTWQIIEGRSRIPVCLIHAVDPVDSGAIVYKDHVDFEGHELIEELRAALGLAHVTLCLRYMREETPPKGAPQSGVPTTYRRRNANDSRVEIEKSIASQFDLLRTVDNDKYPAWFEHRGHRYVLRIDKLS